MRSRLKKVLYANAPLKIISLILGYTFWHLFSHTHTTHVWVTVPLSFYSIPDTTTFDAPETIRVQLAGKRSRLRSLNFEHLAAHINGTLLSPGPNVINLTNKTLLLPDSIKLVDYSPTNIMINVHKTQKLIKEITNTANVDAT